MKKQILVYITSVIILLLIGIPISVQIEAQNGLLQQQLALAQDEAEERKSNHAELVKCLDAAADAWNKALDVSNAQPGSGIEALSVYTQSVNSIRQAQITDCQARYSQ